MARTIVVSAGPAPFLALSLAAVVPATPAPAQPGFLPTLLAGNVESLEQIAVGDLDNDGDFDIVAALVSLDQIVWFKNRDDGTFERLEFFPLPPNPFDPFDPPPDFRTDGVLDVVIADVDSDGFQDVVAASFDDDKVRWFRNDGNQNFTPFLISDTPNGPSAAEVADIDGDGDLDVAAVSFNDNAVRWFENVLPADPPFIAHDIALDLPGATNLALADADGDNDPDIVATSFLTGQVLLYENNGAGSFAPVHVGTGSLGMDSPVLADFDGDGDTDIAAASGFAGRLDWYERTAAGFVTHTITSGPDRLLTLEATDLNGDGHTDLLAGSIDNASVRLFQNNGQAGFSRIDLLQGINGIRATVPLDTDGDLDLDLITAALTDQTVQLWTNTTVSNDAPPVILEQPVPTLVTRGDTAVLTSSAVGVNLDYRWRRNGDPIFNDTRTTGADGPVLSLIARLSDTARYDVVVSNQNGSDTSDAVILAVAGGCEADQNADGTLNGADFNAWLANFNAGCP